MLQKMDRLNGQASENPFAQPQRISNPLVFALVLLTAIITGAGGYWLGVRKTVSSTEKLTALPSPAVTREPTPTVIIQPSSSPLPTSQYATTPIEGWKTYTNTVYGYSLQYPPDATIEPLDLRENPTTSKIVSLWNAQKMLLVYVEVDSVKDVGPITSILYQWVEDHFVKQVPGANPVPESTVTHMSVNNHDVILVKTPQEPNQQPGESYTAYIEKDPNTIIKFKSNAVLPGKDDEKKTIFDKMLSTLQFTTL